MKRKVIGFVLSIMAISFMSCPNLTTDVKNDNEDKKTSIIDAKAAFTVVERIAGYANPTNLVADGINGSTVISAPNDQTWTSDDNTIKKHVSSSEADFNTYPQDRTYTITLNSFKDVSSDYSMTGELILHATFTESGMSMIITNSSQVFSISLVGGIVKKIRSTGLTQINSSLPISGIVVCDKTSFNVEDLE